MVGIRVKFPFGAKRPIFRGYITVSFREGIISPPNGKKENHRLKLVPAGSGLWDHQLGWDRKDLSGDRQGCTPGAQRGAPGTWEIPNYKAYIVGIYGLLHHLQRFFLALPPSNLCFDMDSRKLMEKTKSSNWRQCDTRKITPACARKSQGTSREQRLVSSEYSLTTPNVK